MQEYLIELFGLMLTFALGYVMYRLRQRDKRIEELEQRINGCEKDLAVISVKICAIREDTKEIKDSINALLHRT